MSVMMMASRSLAHPFACVKEPHRPALLGLGSRDTVRRRPQHIGDHAKFRSSVTAFQRLRAPHVAVGFAGSIVRQSDRTQAGPSEKSPTACPHSPSSGKPVTAWRRRWEAISADRFIDGRDGRYDFAFDGERQLDEFRWRAMFIPLRTASIAALNLKCHINRHAHDSSFFL